MQEQEQPEREPLETEAYVERVEIETNGGTPNKLRVDVCWREGKGLNGLDPFINDTTTAHVLFDVNDDVAHIDGVYPDTTRTGEGLYRETLRAVRCLPTAVAEAERRLDVDRVERPADRLVDLLDEGSIDE
jgi:hypothetical protein